jgi:hypothetical protein
MWMAGFICAAYNSISPITLADNTTYELSKSCFI